MWLGCSENRLIETILFNTTNNYIQECYLKIYRGLDKQKLLSVKLLSFLSISFKIYVFGAEMNLIELRLKVPVNNISIMLDSFSREGEREKKNGID